MRPVANSRGHRFVSRVGLMLVGEHFDEVTIYRAARAFEQSGDWKKM
jgi:Asp-tRNA(Asn)/Glu-tRNA(Gln) amidotransferase A subunit family amidase